MDTQSSDLEAFLAEAWKADPSKTVEEARAAAIADIGENVQIRRFAQMTEENGFIASYSHAGGKIGVLLDVETSDAEVSADYIANEEKILMAQIMNDPKESQKPEKVIKGMIQGRIKKELKEICLMDQVYVKAEDGKQSVAAYVKEVAKANGANIAIKGFIRFETGEGIAKKEENFAEEVAKQIGGN